MKRMVLLCWILCVPLAVALAGTWALHAYLPYGEFRVSEKEMQSVIDTHLPQENMGVVLSSAQLHLEKEKLLVTASLHTTQIAGNAYAMDVYAEGKPRYRAGEGSFYFEPTSVVVYTRKQTDTYHLQNEKLCAIDPALAPRGLLEHASAVVEGLVRTSVENFVTSTLEETPVYEVPEDLQGAALSVILDDVSVAPGELVFEFTLTKLAYLALLVLVGLAGSMTAMRLMKRNPILLISLMALCFL